MVTFREMRSYTGNAHYRVDVSWDQLHFVLDKWVVDTMCPLELNPDFQRGHVWTEAQQVAFVEHKMAGGPSGRYLYLNCPGWMHSWKGPFVLVDGLQRVTAVLAFLDGKVKAFGHYFSEYTDRPSLTDECVFTFCVNSLDTRAEVLKWYLELNEGGTPHTKEELDRVRALFDSE